MLPKDPEFPTELPEADLEMWKKMTVAQRITAANRISAFDAWQAGALPLPEAIRSTGLSKSRFYRLAAEWRETRSIDSLGAVAGTAGGVKSLRLDPEAVNALQSVVSDVVRFNRDAGVSEQVRLMVQQAGVPDDKLPSPMRLRQFVEDEVRRIEATGEAGHAVRLDCTAIDIPREGGRPFVMFACLDTGTRLILGSSVLEEPEAVSGYALACEDALNRITKDFAGLPWTKRMTRMEVTAGTDIEASIALVQMLVDLTGVNVQLTQKPKRFGKYLRESVGGSIGRVLFTPAQTESGLAKPNTKDMTPWSIANARGAVEIMVKEYNAEIMSGLQPPSEASPPDALLIALTAMARMT